MLVNYGTVEPHLSKVHWGQTYNYIKGGVWIYEIMQSPLYMSLPNG